MNIDNFNYDVLGRNVLIDIGASVSKGGIVSPDQSKEAGKLAADEAFKVVCISDDGIEALQLNVDDIEKGYYIYLHPHSLPVFRFEKKGRRYALIEIQDIAGFAPDGFDRDLWLLEKEKEKEAEKERIEKQRAKVRESIRKS